MLPSSNCTRALRQHAARLPLALGGLTSQICAQQQAPPTLNLAYEYDSGWHENTGSAPEVVLSFPVIMESAEWMRIYFEDAELSGELHDGSGSILRMTALEDGAVQEMNSRHLTQWQNSSAYFNGGTVLVEVIAQPGSGWNRIAMRSVDIGQSFENPQESICGPADDRLPSNDPRAARLLPVGCTGWMIDDCGRCFLTAGHCSGGSSVAQFNVPPSNPNGSLNQPPPSDQYAVDGSSMQSNGGQGVGNDWAYFGTFANSNTGLTAAAAQGGTYALVPPPPTAGTNIRITGYGVDGGVRNQVQQTHVGPAASLTGGSLDYVTDTQGGNSGSPVIWAQTDQAIGIHAHGGCFNGGGSNHGTASTFGPLQSALSNPQGICEAGWTFPTMFPTLVPPGAPVPLQVTVLGSGNSVTLHYRLSAGSFQTQSMQALGNGIYEGTLPAPMCGDTPEYYFSYVDASCGLTVFPEDAPTGFLSIDVGVVAAVLADSFETDLGWATEVSGATSGAWERGVPVNDPNWPHDPLTDSDGSGSCYLTGNSLGDTDVDGGSVSLISPVLDFTGFGTFVSYDYYHKITNGGIGNDNMRVFGRNGGGPWIALVTHGSNGGLNWRSNIIPAERFAEVGISATNDVQLRFTVSDVGSVNVNEGGLDNFQVGVLECGTAIGTPYCSSGQNGAQLSASGSSSVAANDVTLGASSLPANVNGLFFYGDQQAMTPLGNGTLCVAGANGVFRLSPAVNSGPGGEVNRVVDLSNPPLAAGQVTAGSTWNYQFWFRDGGTSDLTDAIQIQFVP